MNSNKNTIQKSSSSYEIPDSEWKLTIDSLEDAVLLLDLDGKIIRANRIIEQWGPGKIPKFLNLPFNQILHPNCSNPNCYLRRFWPFVKKKMLIQEKYVFETKDDILNRFIQFKFRPILEDTFQNKKNKAFAVLIISDISSQKASAEKLEKLTIELRTIFNAIQDQFLHIDVNGIIIACDGNSDIPNINHKSIGLPIVNVIPNSCKAECLKAIMKTKKNKTPVTVESILEIKNGIQIFEYLFVSVHKDEVIIIIKNITEKKRMESIAQELELMNNLGIIFSSLRHEIGNPINSIKMATTVLIENLKKYSHEKIDEYLKRIMEDLYRIEFLLKNLKSFRMWEDCKPVNTKGKDFFENFVGLIKGELKIKNIKIALSLMSEVDMIFTDPRALHQVLLNVINNASDAIYKQDNAMIYINIKKNLDRINIIIEDNGPGIPESHQNKIFNPFYTTKREGTGLGLFISQKILSRINGSIIINSNKNMGTIVTINIPIGK